jgi:hypothetical protein
MLTVACNPQAIAFDSFPIPIRRWRFPQPVASPKPDCGIRAGYRPSSESRKVTILDQPAPDSLWRCDV